MSAQQKLVSERLDERWRHLLLALTPSKLLPDVERNGTKRYAAFSGGIDELAVLFAELSWTCRGLVLERNELVSQINALRAHADLLEKSRAEAERHAISLVVHCEEATKQAVAERQARERLEVTSNEYATSLKAALTKRDEALQGAMTFTASLQASLKEANEQARAEREARERLQSEADKYVTTLKAEMDALRAQAVAEREMRERLEVEAQQYIASLTRAIEEHVEVVRASQVETESLRTQAVSERAAREGLQVEADEYIASLKALLATHDQALQAAQQELEVLRAAAAQRNKPSAET
jgi:chromosome segregation ATPase